MLRTENEQAEQLIGEFADSVQKIIDELEQTMKHLDDIGESERTKVHRVNKMVKAWFYDNGGL